VDMSIKKKNWPSELMKPIRWSTPGSETVMQSIEQIACLDSDAIGNEIIKKLHLLMEHYRFRPKMTGLV